jgi:effector-binding domain-containing protein
VPATAVLVSRKFVTFDDCPDWLTQAFGDLHDEAERSGLTIDGPDGALYPDEFFEEWEAEVTAFVPVIGSSTRVSELAATVVAVLEHRGALNDVDQTYGSLGTAVAAQGIGVPGPIREHYLPSGFTEVCWPINPLFVQ